MATTALEEQFREMLEEMQQSEAYWIEAARSDISDNIDEMMVLRGMSKADLAKALGTSRSYVTKILQGNANFTVESLVKISMALKCRFNCRNILVPIEEQEK